MNMLLRAFFRCCSLGEVELEHASVEEISERAFNYCVELKTMTVPESLQKVVFAVYSGCSELVPKSISLK